MNMPNQLRRLRRRFRYVQTSWIEEQEFSSRLMAEIETIKDKLCELERERREYLEAYASIGGTSTQDLICLIESLDRDKKYHKCECGEYGLECYNGSAFCWKCGAMIRPPADNEP